MATGVQTSFFGACLFLSLLYLSSHTAFLSLYADLQSVYGGGRYEIRYLPWRMAGHKTYPALSSMGRLWL